MNRTEILERISKERDRQDVLHGDRSAMRLPSADALPALVEEVGEVARAIVERDPHALRLELIQLAAVAVAMLERLELERLDQMRAVQASAVAQRPA